MRLAGGRLANNFVGRLCKSARHGPKAKRRFERPLEAVGLPASRPAATRDDEVGNRVEVPAVEGVRLHDLRHTFATLQLSAGVHFMQVSKWLGHSTYTLTLNIYGDYVPEGDGGAANNLPEPAALPKPANAMGNVVKLVGRQTS